MKTATLPSLRVLPELREAAPSMRSKPPTLLAFNPLVYRKAADNPFQRELVIPAGATGQVVLFEVVDAQTVWVIALRHQREDDDH